MITAQKMGAITWVDVLSPTNEEIAQLQKTYNLNVDIARDLTVPTLIPRIDECDEHLYIVLHFPANKHSHRESAQLVGVTHRQRTGSKNSFQIRRKTKPPNSPDCFFHFRFRQFLAF